MGIGRLQKGNGVTPISFGEPFDDRPSKLYAYADMPDGCTAITSTLAMWPGPMSHGIRKRRQPHFQHRHRERVCLSQVYRYLQEATGKYDVPLIPAGERVGDLRRSALDITQAREILELGNQR